MKNVLNRLIQLQELQFALAEKKASSAKMPLQSLEEAIAETVQSLPAEIGERYQRLQQRYPLAVVPVMHGTCPPCGIALPAALVNAVQAGEQIQNCPHCGRFLYFQETVARSPRKPAGEARPQAGIARFSAVSLMVPSLAATNREEVIGELAQVMAANGFIENAAAVKKLALGREAIVSTAVEHGLAFPHVRNVEGGGLTLALGLKDKGIDCSAPDGKLTKIFFLIVIPTASSAFYLRLLAGLVKTFAETEARKTLQDCDTPEEMWKTLTRLTRETIP
jgi:mannitol/fructose-specific phosphotransferase system IIA component (Ntr-type)